MSEWTAGLAALASFVVTVGGFLASIWVGRRERRLKESDQEHTHNVDLLRLQLESTKETIEGLERDRDYHQSQAGACYRDKDAYKSAFDRYRDFASELRIQSIQMVQHLCSQVRELGGQVEIQVSIPPLPSPHVLYLEELDKINVARKGSS